LAAIGFALVGAAWPASAENAPAVSEGKVETRLDRRTDQQVEERLRATFGALEQLAGVSVEVEAGVVGLSGTVDSVQSRYITISSANRTRRTLFGHASVAR
jgi:osmotically-inducible protein OsmY